MKNRMTFRRLLLATSALLMMAASPARADCKDSSCPAPAQPGAMVQSSRVIPRNVPPSSEQRRPADEVLVLPSQLQEYTTLKTDSGSHFASGLAELNDGDRAALAQMAQQIADRKNKLRMVEVVGFADKQPLSREAQARYRDNQGLSTARAEKAAAFLRGQPGWENVQVTVAGVGDTQTKTSCALSHGPDAAAAMAAYQQCMASDRHTEIRVWYDQPKPLPPPALCRDEQPHDAGLPFRISIDGAPVDAKTDTPNSADVARCTDVALEKADVQVRFDGLEATPVLNVTAWPEGAVRGEPVTFTPYTNYSAFIRRAELRIFGPFDSTQKEPIAVIPVPAGNGEVSWTPRKETGVPYLRYILRVYDGKGRFDETTPKQLDLLDARRFAQPEDNNKRAAVLAGYGENHLGIHNIKVSGGAVTVNGTHAAPNGHVQVMGQDVPVDSEGKFAVRQIMPAGAHDVQVVTNDAGGGRDEFSRSINIPKSEWFYIGIADLTVGQNAVSGPAALVTGDTSDRYREKIYADGRLAYYIKGKPGGGWQITSSADTQEQPIEDLFSNFDEKDPRALLRRLDPNAYYPVYGDDSTEEEDAPTRGKFYLKAEKDGTSAMWGNFQTQLTGTDLMNYSRTLYGADLRHKSDDVTQYGEKRTEVELFAADPGTLDAIEEFRGTGGSLYYLHHQDVTVGSERLRVEVRDRDSGIVLQSTTLIYGQDYDVNYIQGRVILREALPSTSDAVTLVREGSLGGNPVFLVAGYEFSPGVTEADNMTKGGRASHWLNDHIRVGATGYQQKGSGVAQTIAGGDLTLRYKPGTYIKAESAHSDGPGTGAFSSQNGGFDFGAIPQTTAPGLDADAQRVEAALDLREVTGTRDGRVSGYWIKRDDGFSAPGQLTNEGVRQSGGIVQLPITEKFGLTAKGDVKEGSTSGTYKTLEGNVDYRLRPELTLSLGARHDDRDTALAAGASAVLAQTGARTDGVVKLGYAPFGEDGGPGRYEVYALAQNTLDHDSTRSGNDRYGGGGRFQLNDRVGLNGELTGGDGGLGGRAGVDYRVDDRTSHYINYLADNGRTDTGYRGRSNSLIAGTRSRYSDSLSVFSEERYVWADQAPSGIIHSYGLDYAANDRWTFSSKFETGVTSDPATGDLDRTAASLSAGYKNDKVKYGGTLEWREEDGNTTGKRTSWLSKNTLGYQTTPDWRAIGAFNIAVSDAGAGATTDADFTELTLGLGYRPVDNDKFNALVKYTYLADQGSPGQLSSTGGANPFEQRSHVFSGDAIYDLTPKLSLGGKLGYRFGALRDDSIPGSPWFDSTAWLAIGRLDYHVVHEWDISGEYRYLDAEEAGDARQGALVGVYKHINENARIGVGYNFTDFSDDLTNLDYTSQGLFLNLTGSF